MNELHKTLKAGGLRKVFVGLFMFSSLCGLLLAKVLDASDFTSLAKILVVTLLPSMASEHFAPKDTATGA